MSELPQSWAEATIEDCAILNPKHDRDVSGDTLVSFVPMPAVSDVTGEIESLQTRRFSEVSKGYTHFQSGDVIFAKITPCMENGKIAVARDLTNGLACGSTEFHVLRPRGAISPDYLWRYLRQRTFRVEAERSMTGAVGQRRVPLEYLKAAEIPLPPVAEQRRIVAQIDGLSAKSNRARDQLDHVPRLVEKYKQAILAAALCGDLTREWRSREEEQVAHLDENAGLLNTRHPRRSVPQTASPSEFVTEWPYPKKWKLAHLGRYIFDSEIIDVKDGNHGANHPRRGEFTAEGVPFITAAQLTGNVINYQSAPRIAGQPLKRLRVGFAERGDIILSHKGTVGRVALCNAACVLSPQTTYYRPSPSAFTPEFLRFQLLSPFFQRQLNEVKSQTTRDFVPISEQYRLFLLRPSLTRLHLIYRQLAAVLVKPIFDSVIR